ALAAAAIGSRVDGDTVADREVAAHRESGGRVGEAESDEVGADVLAGPAQGADVAGHQADRGHLALTVALAADREAEAAEHHAELRRHPDETAAIVGRG